MIGTTMVRMQCDKFARLAAGVVACGAVALIGVTSGCAESEEPIRQYTINTQVPAALESRDRMLGAILPHGDQVWFYKLAGPVDAVEYAENDLKKYVTQVQFADGQPVIGDLPAGWEQERQSRPMRFATLLIDTPSKQLELSISSLPKLENWDEQLAMNVNRWREQMGLAASDAQWAGATALPLAHAADTAAVWIDFSGKLGAGPSMAGLAGGMGALPADHPPVASRPAAAATSPNSNPTPPMATASDASDAAPAKPSGLDFTVPEGWRPGKMSMMRLAAFEIGQPDQMAELTIIGAGGDLRGNVARWLGEIRPEPPADDVVDAAMDTAEMITVSGREAFRYVLDDGREEGADKQMTDATIVPMGDGFSMFIKARGPAETIRSQHDAIGQFMQSLTLP